MVYLVCHCYGWTVFRRKLSCLQVTPVVEEDDSNELDPNVEQPDAAAAEGDAAAAPAEPPPLKPHRKFLNEQEQLALVQDSRTPLNASITACRRTLSQPQLW